MNKLKILKILARREEYLKNLLKEEKENEITWNFEKEEIQQRISEVGIIAMIINCAWEEE